MASKKKTAVIALITGTVMLTGAALANFAASNGYNVYKSAVRRLFDQDNYTISAKVSVSFDGEKLLEDSTTEKYDKVSNQMIQLSSVYDSYNSDTPLHETESYYLSDGTRIRHSNSEAYYGYGDIPSDTYYVYDVFKGDYFDPTLSKSNFAGAASDEDADKLFDKYYAFASSCADLVIGDIKNNFVLTDTSDGYSTYELKLDLFQIPEVVNSGIDLIASQVSAAYDHDMIGSSDDPEEIFLKIAQNPTVSGASCLVTVDSDGLLTKNVLSADLTGKDSSGQIHTVTFTVEINGGDYGTTVIEMPDLEGKNMMYESEVRRKRVKELEILMADPSIDEDDLEAYKHEYDENNAILKMLNENGMIDEEEFYSTYYNDDDEPEAVYDE